MCFNSVAFKNVISNGLVLDKEGQKMSKRIGNVIDPFKLIEKYGADPVRWYMVSNSNPWENLKFDVSGIEDVSRRFFGTLFNTYSFFALYANIDKFNTSNSTTRIQASSVLDRWILSELNSLILRVASAYDNFDATRVTRDIQSFALDKLSNWYVRLCRRRFWKNTLDEDKLLGFEILHQCLCVVSKMSSPIAPFYMDHLYRDLTGDQSVHLCSFPNVNKELINPQLEDEMGVVRSVVSLGLSLRKKEKIRVRQPISSVSVVVKNSSLKSSISSFSKLILSELNVKNFKIIENNSALVKKSLELNYAVLGKKHGKLIKEIKTIVYALPADQVSVFENQKKIEILVGGQKIVLGEEDLLIKSKASVGWSVAENKDALVAIDTKIDESLLGEGVSREFINRVQNLRKSLGFNVTDLVDVFVFGNNDFLTHLKNHKNYVCEETLTNNLVFEKSKRNNSSEVEISRYKVYIALTLSK